MDILSNLWFIGIIGGIISGIFVVIIARITFSKKDRSDYIKNVRLANKEVLSALRPTISENYFPGSQIINSLIEANSRKFKVNKRDMYNIKQIAEEMTKEIMDASFISCEKKEDLCKHLINLHKEEVNNSKSIVIHSLEDFEAYRKKLIDNVTIIFGVMTAILTILMTCYKEMNTLKLTSIDSSYEILFIPITIIFLSLIMSFSILLYKKIKRKTLERRLENDPTSGKNIKL